MVEVKADKRGRRVYRCPQCWEGKRHFEIYFLENSDAKEKLKMCEVEDLLLIPVAIIFIVIILVVILALFILKLLLLASPVLSLVFFLLWWFRQ